jgi:hypothetical protein
LELILRTFEEFMGDQPLGNEFCEVVVNVVIKWDAMLPRGYGEMQTMATALNMNITWPFNKVIN